jgi:hypothetical protein
LSCTKATCKPLRMRMHSSAAGHLGYHARVGQTASSCREGALLSGYRAKHARAPVLPAKLGRRPARHRAWPLHAHLHAANLVTVITFRESFTHPSNKLSARSSHESTIRKLACGMQWHSPAPGRTGA